MNNSSTRDSLLWSPCVRATIVLLASSAVALGQADDYGEDQQPQQDGSTEPMHFVIVSKTHFDIGYSALARDVIHEYRTTMIDRALTTIEQNAKVAAPDEGYVWTIPGWPMRTILWDGQHPHRRRRVEAALTQGSLAMHALPFTLHTATADVETLARGFGYASSVARQYGLDFPVSAKMTDVPGHDWIVPTLLRHAGVKMFHFGSNPTNVQVKLPIAFWWEGPDGSRVLTMYSSGYATGLLPPPDWPHKTWLAMVMSGDNQGPHNAQQVRGWIGTIRSKFPGAKITVGSMDDFAEAFLAENPHLPVVRGNISDSWIHGPMSSPRAAGELMNIRPRVRAMEALRTHNMIWGVKFKHLPGVIAKAYDNSLRWSEHTWGLANQHYAPGLHGEAFHDNHVTGLTPNYAVMEQSWREHDQFSLRIKDNVIPALEDDLHTLAENVAHPGTRVVVFNPAPRPRGGVVDFVFPFMGSIKGHNAVQDVQTGAVFPLKTWGQASHRNGRFVVGEIPPMGYKTFVFVAGAKLPSPTAVGDVAEHRVENRFFKIVFDPSRGCIKSIINKVTGAELVDAAAPHGFGQYLYQQFSRKECFDYTNTYVLSRYHGSHRQITGKCDFVPESAKHVDFSPGAMNLRVEPTGYGVVARLIPPPSAGGAAHTAALTVTLFNDLPYLDVQLNVVNHPATENPEAGWLCLPLNIEQPGFRIKGPGSIFNPASEVIEGSNFAYYWTQGGLAVLDQQAGGVGIGLPDCPAVSLGRPGIYRFAGKWDAPQAHVYVNLFNNKWNTNFRSFWSGDLTARVRLWAIDQYDNQRHLTTPVAHTLSPLLTGLSNYTAGELPTSARGVSLSRSGVLLTAFGPNPDGDGTLLRVWEDAGQSGELTVALPAGCGVERVQPIDLRGRPVGEPIVVTDGKFTCQLGKYQPRSFLVSIP